MNLVSKGAFHETIIQNGQVVKDIAVNSFQERKKNKTKYLIEGRNNNVPFIITNMRKGLMGKSRSKKSRKSKRGKSKRGKIRKTQNKNKKYKNKT